MKGLVNMEIINKHPKIYLLSGKARNGKDTTAEFLKKFYEADGKKVIYSRAGKYIKFYASEMTGWDGKEETKPRQLLQELGTDVIRNKLNKADMLIERQLDDIEIYSYFYDAIIVPDIRLPKEIDSVKAKFDNVVAIHINRINFESDLSSNQQSHITETAMDNYTNFDYEVTNDTLEQLEKDIYKIYKEETK
jgi:hypothetical protein